MYRKKCVCYLPWDVVVHIPTMQAICCHEHVLVISDISNSVITTPAANNGCDDMEYCDIINMPFLWCDGTNVLSMSNNIHIFAYVV